MFRPDGKKFFDIDVERHLNNGAPNYKYSFEDMLNLCFTELPTLKDMGVNKAIVLFVKDTEGDEETGEVGEFKIFRYMKDISSSEMLAVAEILKIRALEDMGYVKGSE